MTALELPTLGADLTEAFHQQIANILMLAPSVGTWLERVHREQGVQAFNCHLYHSGASDDLSACVSRRCASGVY